MRNFGLWPFVLRRRLEEARGEAEHYRLQNHVLRDALMNANEEVRRLRLALVRRGGDAST